MSGDPGARGGSTDPHDRVRSAGEVFARARATGLAGRPFAFLDLAAFRANVRKIREAAAGKPVRFATKSIRSIDALRALAREWGSAPPLMLYSPREVRPLLAAGFRDLFVAYPTLDLEGVRDALQAVGEVAGASGDESRARDVVAPSAAPRLRFATDHRDQLDVLARARDGLGAAGTVHLVVDVDASWAVGPFHFGVHRSSLRTRAAARALFVALAALERAATVPAAFGSPATTASPPVPAFRTDGLMTYDAQIAGLADRSPFHRARNPFAAFIRRRSRSMLARRRLELAEDFRAAFGRAPDLHNGGGSGSLDWTAADAAIDELAAGSGLYAPHLFDGYSNIAFEPALFFALPVSRRPDERTATCSFGGYIASGAPGWDRLAIPVDPPGLRYFGDEGAGEVQTSLRSPAGRDAPPIGSHIIFRSAKAGEVLEHFDRVHVIDPDAPSTADAPMWATYRGAGIGG